MATAPIGGEFASEIDFAAALHRPSKAELRALAAEAVATSPRMVECPECGHRGRVAAGRSGRLRCSRCAAVLAR